MEGSELILRVRASIWRWIFSRSLRALMSSSMVDGVSLIELELLLVGLLVLMASLSPAIWRMKLSKTASMVKPSILTPSSFGSFQSVEK